MKRSGAMTAIMVLLAAGAAVPALAADNVSGFIHAILGHTIDEKFLDEAFDVRLEVIRNEPRELRLAGAGPVLADGTRIERMEWIRYAHGSPAPVIIGATIGGRCIPLADIEAAFPHTDLLALPTHGYPDAVATYRTRTDGGTVEFFINYHTRCLSTVKITMG